MNKLSEIAKKNILSLSKNKNNYILALKEWTFSGNIHDHKIAKETCELCKQENLRYHFEIYNELGNKLLVGSSCIDKFDITVFNKEGIEITKNKKSYLTKALNEKQINDIFYLLEASKTTEKLWDIPKKNLDKYCIDYFNKNKTFNAKIINYLFLRFEEEKIQFNPKLFKINIRSFDNLEIFLKLNTTRFERIKNCLEKNQIEIYLNNKHK